MSPPPFPSAPAPKPAAPPPLPAAVAAAPPSAAAAKSRFRQAIPTAPVPQMPAGGPPEKKGKSPFFWIAIGCCGCLVLGLLLVAVIGGGAFMATKGPADATHAWLGDVRKGQSPEAGLTEAFRARLSAEDLRAIAGTIAQSKDATFLQRSIDNDRATLRGVLTGGPTPQPIAVTLVKEGGRWKVDNVMLGVE